MLRQTHMLILVSCLAAPATIIDRMAVIVGKGVVKDSDIERDIRVTSFLNNTQPDFSTESRKAAAGRLIDQELMREQIRTGEYPVAAESDVDRALAEIRKERFANDMQYQQALKKYGVTEAELKDRLSWQLTVMHFIDARFRPAVVVSDQDVQRYYDTHRAELMKQHPEAKSLDDLKPQIEELISGEQINKLLDDWLNQRRQQTRIQFMETSLQ